MNQDTHAFTLASKWANSPEWEFWDIIWYYVIWYDMIWYGMVWYGMIWCDMIRYDMIWYGIGLDGWDEMRWDEIRCDVIWYDMTRHDTTRHYMTWYGILDEEKKSMLDEVKAESNIAFLVQYILYWTVKHTILYILSTIAISLNSIIVIHRVFSISEFGTFICSTDRRPNHWSRGVGECGLVSKLSNITYIGQFSQNCPIWLFVKEI